MGKRAGMVNIHDIAKTAALEAFRAFKNEERERIKKARFHNTELLLKNYYSLKEHAEHSKYKASDLEDIEDFDFDVEMDDVIVQAIKRSKMRTTIMLNQIDTVLSILQRKMQAKSQPEKFEIIWKLYIDQCKINVPRDEKVKIIASEVHCGEASVRRWKNEMIAEMSILLFGVDGLKLDI